MSIDATHLAARLTGAISSGAVAGQSPMSWLWPALLRSLARGRPVAVEDLAQATGRRSADRGDCEGDVEQAVAGTELPARFQDRGDRGAR